MASTNHSAENILSSHNSSNGSGYFHNSNGMMNGSAVVMGNGVHNQIVDSKQTPNFINKCTIAHNDQNSTKNGSASNNSTGSTGEYGNQSSNGISSNGSGASNINNSSNGTNNNLTNNNDKNFNNDGENTLTQNARLFTNGQKDILRLIGQHLRYLGLNKTTEHLIKESGCMLEHPMAVSFCSLIMNGEWEGAEKALDSLVPIMEESWKNITHMRFLILEQKYLENLEDGKILDALKCLRDELAPLKYNIERLHELSSFLMCSDQSNLKSLSKWSGKNAASRQILMNKLQTFLPPNIMLPPHRLETLLDQSISYQCEKCPYHNIKEKGSLDNWSFLKDHVCSKDEFPSVCLQVLNDHCDEVIICKFSNNGKKLATGSKDGCLFIWNVDPQTYKLTLNKCYEDHSCGVCYVSWSPDDRFLIVCGADESNELWIWDIENKVLKKRINNNHDDSLTSAAWLQDGQTFVAGGVKGQFYYCDLDGNIRDTWEGVRVQALQCLPDGLVLAADKLNRIRSYNFKEISDSNVILEDYPIMSFVLNKDSTLCLVSLSKQCLHLWDIKDRCLIHRYQGTVQAHFISHPTFGGVDENFIAGGSEDSRVYIWNKKNENAICILEGHSKPVTSVSWNPVQLGMLASASDDGTVRIWGPKCKSSDSSITSNQNGICIDNDNISNLNNDNLQQNQGNNQNNNVGGQNSSYSNNHNQNISNNHNLPHHHNLASQNFGSFHPQQQQQQQYSNMPQFLQHQQSMPSNTRSDRSTPV